MEWISVKDRLPRVQEEILVYGKTQFREIKYYDVFQGSFPEGTTHWMPFEPPQEENKNGMDKR